MAEEKNTVSNAAPPLETPSTVQEICQTIEAILFAAGYPIRYDKLSEVLGLGVKDIKNLVQDMATHFNEATTHHGIQLLLYPSSCQLCTKEQFAPYVKEALGIRRGGNLSSSSMEVLAVVAYNQPVTRSFIDLVRGIDSSYAVNSLLDKGLIEAAGRLDAPGRPMLYVTTDKFLRVFGINNLDELPETEALSVAAQNADQLTMDKELGENNEDDANNFESDNPPAEYQEAVDSEETNVIMEDLPIEPKDGQVQMDEDPTDDGGSSLLNN